MCYSGTAHAVETLSDLRITMTDLVFIRNKGGGKCAH